MCVLVCQTEILMLFFSCDSWTWASSRKDFRLSASLWSSWESRPAYTVWPSPNRWPRSWSTCSSTLTMTSSWKDLPNRATIRSRRREDASSSDVGVECVAIIESCMDIWKTIGRVPVSVSDINERPSNERENFPLFHCAAKSDLDYWRYTYVLAFLKYHSRWF